MSKYPYWMVQYRRRFNVKREWCTFHHIASSKSNAIEIWNSKWPDENSYQRLHRHGVARIVRCAIKIEPQDVKS